MNLKLIGINILISKKTFTLILYLTLSFSFLILNSYPLLAQCNLGASTKDCPAAGVIQLQELLTRMINISVTLAFMAMTVWLVWSAIKFFITSGGDPKALSQAWASVTWIFMGIVFMVLAYLALKLVGAFVGFDVTKYCLGFPPYCV